LILCFDHQLDLLICHGINGQQSERKVSLGFWKQNCHINENHGHANTFSDEIEKKKHQEGTCSFPTCCSEAIEVTSPTNLKDAKSKMHPVPCRMTRPSREIIK